QSQPDGVGVANLDRVQEPPVEGLVFIDSRQRQEESRKKADHQSHGIPFRKGAADSRQEMAAVGFGLSTRDGRGLDWRSKLTKGGSASTPRPARLQRQPPSTLLMSIAWGCRLWGAELRYFLGGAGG